MKLLTKLRLFMPLSCYSRKIKNKYYIFNSLTNEYIYMFYQEELIEDFKGCMELLTLILKLVKK
jgi:hypothetical protein